MRSKENKTAKTILFVGIAILVAGIALIIYSYIGISNKSSRQATIDALLRQLDTTQARFEIGYALMDIELYKDNYDKYKAGDSSLLTYPVYTNEITTRIQTDSPQVKPDYGKMPIANKYLRTFATTYKQRKLTHLRTGVICLIVKQMGKGKADSVTLDVDRVAIRDVEEIYDALELGGNEFYEEGIRRSYNRIQKQHFSFGVMETGHSILVPLCITNIYQCLNCEMDPSGWQVTSYTAYVPLTINFSDKQGKRKTISLSENLAKPIYMGK